MLYIVHRVNTVGQLANVPIDQGVEIDVRDHGDRLVLQHDPFRGDSGEDLESYLDAYRHRLLILNIKSERIEPRVREALRQRGIEDYFFLDSTVPMIRTLLSLGERRIAVRFSECEPIEAVMAFAGHVEWAWIDCFTRMPLTPVVYEQLVKHFRLCIVSPELQGRPVEDITAYGRELAGYPFDAVCTKRVDLWRHVIDGP